MHILMALVGILGVAAFWYWRVKAIKETADDVTDMAGRAWGQLETLQIPQERSRPSMIRRLPPSS